MSRTQTHIILLLYTGAITIYEHIITCAYIRDGIKKESDLITDG